MPPTADSPASSTPRSEISGKWLIIGIFGVALVAAGTSWWFRFHTTHRAAEFWGSGTAILIRDAPVVRMYHSDGFDSKSFDDPESVAGKDVSEARGLVHLRNALLEDQGYNWPDGLQDPNDVWPWAMAFLDKPSGRVGIILFSPDFKFVRKYSPASGSKLSCEPIAAGLREMFADFAAFKPDESSEKADAPAR